ncbi:hypothetical protein [Azospirillum doebereinerae]|uniref:Uncharacterized protein n=1 Tax=Azospirillum doebereinerae TaxID=92933 RepID=A0A3S0VJF2_9PROT|nr:hypothetical protein [Azospirillum doebereinerae]MCG5242763.1 hypothetical protein [Azospirillum doebereinerae]RUQ73677.1 hypothetical protein EJ913_08420 [Azospirillum doebereinerae]
MSAPNTSTLVSRMIAMAGQPDEAIASTENQAATRVKRIVWSSQAAKLQGSLSARAVYDIETAVTLDLDSMELPEVFFTSVEVGGRVITCDLDASGTASIFGLIEAGEYDDLVEEAGDDALFGVDWDGVYITPARTRH